MKDSNQAIEAEMTALANKQVQNENTAEEARKKAVESIVEGEEWEEFEDEGKNPTKIDILKAFLIGMRKRKATIDTPILSGLEMLYKKDIWSPKTKNKPLKSVIAMIKQKKVRRQINAWKHRNKAKQRRVWSQ